MNSNKLTHNLVQYWANYSRMVKTRISHYSSRINSIISTNPVGSILSWALVVWVPIIMLANWVSEAKWYTSNEVRWSIIKTYRFSAKPINYDWQIIPWLLTQQWKYQVLDFKMFKKVTKRWIGPTQFVQEEFKTNANWQKIKWKLVSEKWEILTDPLELRYNQAYMLTNTMEQSVEIAKSIKWLSIISTMPLTPKQIVNEWKQALAKIKVNTDKQSEIRVRAVNASYGSNMIDSLDIPWELHNEIWKIFSKLNINANAHTFLKWVAKKESNCWDTTINYLIKAKQSSDSKVQISCINFAIGNILWTSNDAALFQITPWFAWLKGVDGNVMKNREELKNHLFSAFLRYVNPELFEAKLNAKKVENSRQHTAFVKVSSIVDWYLTANNKSKLEIDDLFKILAKIDVRFANKEMWVVVVNSFIKDYKEISASNSWMSHIEKVKLALSRYNKWILSATVETRYANSVLWNISSFAWWETQLVKAQEKSITEQISKPTIQQDRLDTIQGETQAVLKSLPQKESIKLVASVAETTHKTLTNPKILTNIKDEVVRASINSKLEEAPLEIQIAHYEKDATQVSTLKKLYEIDYKIKANQLEKAKQQLNLVISSVSKIESWNLSDEFSKIRLNKFKDAKYTLEKQIAYLEASMMEIEWKDIYKYAMVV